MDIYVKSRGSNRSHEYLWINQNHEKDEPSILYGSFSQDSDLNFENRKEFRITDFHNLDRPAIILLRNKQKLLLLLTGIKAQWSAPGGAVYHSVAWLCHSPTTVEEEEMRKLVIHALKEISQGVISASITSSVDVDLGFQVDFERLKSLSLDETLQAGSNSKNLDIGRFSPNTQDYRDALISELTQSRFPQDDGFLVVISDFVSASILEEVKVWRGLSNRIEESKEYKLKKKSIQNKGKNQPAPSAPTQQTLDIATYQSNLKQVPDNINTQEENKHIQVKLFQNCIVLFLIGLLIGIVLGLLIAQIYIERTGKPLFIIPQTQNQAQQSLVLEKEQNQLSPLLNGQTSVL